MSKDNNTGSKLIEWYRSHIRPFFVTHNETRVAEFDADCERLRSIHHALEKPMPICLLGISGIGKSTLINSLVFGMETYVPSGGIGPLTAQALSVCYDSHASFQVLYHGPDRLNRLIFGLERHYQAQNKPAEATSAESHAEPDALGLIVEDEAEARDLAELVNGDETAKEKTMAALRKQALVMITGDQHEKRELSYLIDALRTVYGLGLRNETVLREDDLIRIEGLKRAFAFGKAKSSQTFAEAATPEFKLRLHEHATGYLAPLIKNLEVRWPTPLLQTGLTLVDLPGVGVAGDVHAGVTEEYIREKARGVMLVVRVRGVTNDEADLLDKSGFLNRLLHAADDPAADPVSMTVVVTYADVIADTRYKQDKTKRRPDHFQDVRRESAESVKAQLKEELEKVWRSSKGEISDTRSQVLRRLLSELQVHVVSAPEFQKFLEKDEGNPAFIRSEEESGIPQLVAALHQHATESVKARQKRLVEEEKRFFRRLRARLAVINAQWEEQTRAEDLAVELQTQLDAFAEPLRKEFSNRQGAFREFLKNTLPTIIEKVVIESGVKARKEIYAYMQEMETAHWKTLQASVRRGGTYFGSRQIDLPHDFARKFETPIAESWGTKLLKEIRTRTREYTNDSVELVEKILTWAKQNGAKPKTTLLEAMVELIKADASKLNSVGKEALEELREEIKNSLAKKVEGPIRKKCEKFVERNLHNNPGVKRRILDLFGELADETIEAATEPAIKLLTVRFRSVEEEILRVFEEHQEHRDPVTAAINAIVSQYEEKARKVEKKERNNVLDTLATITKTCPPEWEAIGQQETEVA